MGNENDCYEWVEPVQDEVTPVAHVAKALIVAIIGIAVVVVIFGLILLALGIPVGAI